HKIREETFTVLYGDLTLVCDGVVKNMKKGETVTVSRGVKNSFFSETGCVFEEISTTHRKADSFYSNENGFVCPRKTKVYLTEDILKEYAEL
ncbi:MAG: hypothetical protein LBM93_15930, partial [Oscillospiraceae bacterium]|nr:hypothetical protein [Oscillospiraceae bacterium]